MQMEREPRGGGDGEEGVEEVNELRCVMCRLPTVNVTVTYCKHAITKIRGKNVPGKPGQLSVTLSQRKTLKVRIVA